MPYLAFSLSRPRVVAFLAALSLLATSHHAVAADVKAPPPAAIPAPVAKTTNAISVLLIGGQNNHDWKIGNDFLVTLLNRQPGISVVESNTPAKGAPVDEWAAWHPEFQKYQCVVLDYNGEKWPTEVQSSFEKYVAGGGTVILIHAANNSFTGWTEYEKMVGLLWRGKDFGASLYLDDNGAVVREEPGQGRDMGHGKQWDWQLTVRDTTNPIAAGMPLKWKHVKDELYHGQRGPAENVHILLSAFDDQKYNGFGKNEPIVWWVPYGQGKVLTNVMGHIGDSSAPLSCVGFQTVFLRSIEWLVTGKCATPIPADFPTADQTSQRYPGEVPRLPLVELTPQEAMARIKVPAGYHLELVASDPTIVQPVLCTWDGDGRMYVAELRSYMLDVDAGHENEPTSRVTRLTDTNGDGVMDKATVFADNLLLPRMVLPLDDRVVISETYTGKFVSYRDTTGNGVANETKELFSGEATKANLEHQDTGLQWGLDNYLYTGRLSRRFHLKGDAMESEQMYGNTSQWGLGMDDLGHFYCSAAGGERAVFGFQQLPNYGGLSLPGETAEGFDEPFPIVQTLDTQGGPGRIHNLKGTLNHFTGVAGQSIFRGDRLPQDLVGDYLLPEPVGRLIRRAKVNVVDGKRVLSNATPGAEFIASTDLAFRPVWTATGPDGCLYIVDMHHGIIQEGAWVTPGAYLRDTVLREGYDKYIGHGRIYRLVHDGFQPGPQPHMLEETAAQLVAHLSHPNGWWRDTAQKLIVLKGDQSVVPALTELARHGAAPLGRMHALWTLDGLGATDRQLVIDAFGDSDERVRQAAIRLSEAYLKKGDPELLARLQPHLQDPSMDVVVQAVNSLRYVPAKAAHPLLQAVASAHIESDIITASTQQSLKFDPLHPGAIGIKIDPVGMALIRNGRDHFNQICFACHGPDGKGVITSDGMHLAPPLVGSPRVLGSPAAVVRIVLHGLVGEVDGKAYPGLMVPQGANDDLWVAETLTYIRNAFGNTAPTITPEQVATIRTAAGAHAPYTMAELAPFLTVPSEVISKWTITASDNEKGLKLALDGDMKTRWSSNKPQQQGEWLQFDMGQPFQLTSLCLDASPSKDDYPRGYEVRTSDDGEHWSAPIASGKGATVTTIEFPTWKPARYLRITQTGSDKGCFWSINELGIYGAEAK